MNINSEKILETKDLADGQMKTVMVHNVPVALAHIGGSFFAVSDVCTHAQCSLGTDGFLTGNTVMCGCHGAAYDMTNGKVLSLPAVVDLDAYTVEVKDGWIYVGKKEL